jgi:hypothetical protein
LVSWGASPNPASKFARQKHERALSLSKRFQLLQLLRAFCVGAVIEVNPSKPSQATPGRAQEEQNMRCRHTYHDVFILHKNLISPEQHRGKAWGAAEAAARSQFMHLGVVRARRRSIGPFGARN